MKLQTWFEQKIDNIRSWLNHYFPKFNNYEKKSFGEIPNMNPFTNGCNIFVDSGNCSGIQYDKKEIVS